MKQRSLKATAVRLPKAVAFPQKVKEVEIIAKGNKRIIVPADQSWDDWFDKPGVSEDFMNERMQEQDTLRESF